MDYYEKAYDLDNMRQLHSDGLSNRSIGREIGVHHDTVGRILDYLDLESNTTPHTERPLVGNEDFATCSRCNKEQPIGFFQRGRVGTNSEYRFSYCNDCRNARNYETWNSNDKTNMKRRHGMMKRKARSAGIPFTITFEDFWNQFQEQGGECIYTGQKMDWSVGEKGGVQPDSFSIDKIDPSKGYVPGNVVFCTYRANTIKYDMTPEEFKEWMPGWYEKIKHRV